MSYHVDSSDHAEIAATPSSTYSIEGPLECERRQGHPDHHAWQSSSASLRPSTSTALTQAAPPRARLTSQQTNLLEYTFKMNSHPDLAHRELLAAHAGMNAKQVNVWFQNRRQKLKHSATRAAAGKPPPRQRKDPHLPVAAMKRPSASCAVMPGGQPAVYTDSSASPASNSISDANAQCQLQASLQRSGTWGGSTSRSTASTLLARRRTINEAHIGPSAALTIRRGFVAPTPCESLAPTPSLGTGSSLWTEASFPETATHHGSDMSQLAQLQQELLDGFARSDGVNRDAAVDSMQDAQQVFGLDGLGQQAAPCHSNDYTPTQATSMAECSGQLLGLGLSLPCETLPRTSTAGSHHQCDAPWQNSILQPQQQQSAPNSANAVNLPDMLQAWLCSSASSSKLNNDNRRHSTTGHDFGREALSTDIWNMSTVEAPAAAASENVAKPAGVDFETSPLLADLQRGSSAATLAYQQPSATWSTSVAAMTAPPCAPSSADTFSDPALKRLLCGMNIADACSLPLPLNQSACPKFEPHLQVPRNEGEML
ncbi:hypothetical protein IE81DRAFT_348874 [Ceraceosorus guamensis]|uniref:Homeobox domain-containing protein n=1 Tax=Ceraceosorus guamensis TaxID=1522189 RepID=A0A316VTC8_9BASI|nr:hypothetical protein IE81DRAFT_348874 [Ceraceosorus guamensis]PWN40859.1 hypothetical protein IE81DRAFT_348874 [Ceraceosorus guamensis]